MWTADEGCVRSGCSIMATPVCTCILHTWLSCGSRIECSLETYEHCAIVCRRRVTIELFYAVFCATNDIVSNHKHTITASIARLPPSSIVCPVGGKNLRSRSLIAATIGGFCHYILVTHAREQQRWAWSADNAADW